MVGVKSSTAVIILYWGGINYNSMLKNQFHRIKKAPLRGLTNLVF
jgi:hypothetical protein